MLSPTQYVIPSLTTKPKPQKGEMASVTLFHGQNLQFIEWGLKQAKCHDGGWFPLRTPSHVRMPPN